MNETARTITRIDKPKAGYYKVHFSDGTADLYPRVTSALSTLAKPALVHWSANIEREYVIEKAKGIHVEAMKMKAQGVDPHTFGVDPGEIDPQEVPLLAGAGFESAVRAVLGEKRAHQLRLKEAGDIGSGAHGLVQKELNHRLGAKPYVREAGDEDGPEIAFMAWQDWADSVGLEPLFVERSVASMRMKVAGTIDCGAGLYLPEQALTPRPTGIEDDDLMIGDQVPCVLDWKSSKRSKSAPNGIYPEAIIQASVYREVAVEEELVMPDAWAAVVRLPKSLDDPSLKGEGLDVEWIDPQRAMRYASGFMSILDAHNFMKNEFS